MGQYFARRTTRYPLRLTHRPGTRLTANLGCPSLAPLQGRNQTGFIVKPPQRTYLYLGTRLLTNTPGTFMRRTIQVLKRRLTLLKVQEQTTL